MPSHLPQVIPDEPLIVFASPTADSEAAADGVVLRVWGEVDVTTAGQLEAALREVRRSGCRVVRVDLARTTFLDCAGLRVLVQAHNEFLHANGALLLIGVGHRIARLLQITHLDEALVIDERGDGSPRGRHLAVVADGGTR